MKTYTQLSIREGLILVFIAGLAVAGLSRGGLIASAFLAVALVITAAFAITMFVGRDLLRSYSIGFIVPVVVYAITLLAVGQSELDPYEGNLPTTKLLRPLFEVIVKREYIDFSTGKVIQDFDPAKNVGMLGGGNVGQKETPDRTTFTSLAHVVLAMIFGYIGARFAMWIHEKQQFDTATTE